MKSLPASSTLIRLAAAALAASLALAAPAAKADSYALIMAIDYRGTPAALPGIDKDAEIARRIAQQLNVPDGNIRSLPSSDLSAAGVRSMLADVASRVTKDDSVFIYYSGHGTQDGGGGGKCREGMVGADLKVIWNDELTALLTRVAEGSSRMIIMNDSCFSGGQMSADKSAGSQRSLHGSVPKLLDMVSKAPTTDVGNYTCGSPINKAFRDLGVVASKRGNNYVYLAAASDREVALATSSGSAATRAWQACLARPDTDTNRDGMISGAELNACAQREIDGMQFNQHTQVAGAQNMALLGSGGGSAPVSATGLLESIRSGANSDVSVSLTVDNPTLRIDKDNLNFSVRLDRGGYLYLLHAGPDGKFHVLFPNKIEQDNRVSSGVHQFPRPKWAIQAQGPESAEPGGLIAVLTEQPREFTKGLDQSGTFAEGENTSSLSRKLGVVATTGRYGASQVVRIREVR